MDVEHVAVIDDGTHVVVLLGGLGERQEAVEVRQEVGINLYLRDERLHGLHQLVEQPLLE